jgi:hypothetical protein
MSGYSDDDRDDRDRDDRDRDDRDRDRRDDAYDIRTAKGMVTVPAIGLIIIAVITMVSVVLNLIQFPTLDAQFDAQVKKIEDDQQIPANQKKEQIQLMNQIRDFMKVGFLPYLALIGVFALIMLVGGIKLMSLGSPGLVYAAAILSILPCSSACCVLGLVFGIWTIVVMGKPEVKAGFAARRRASRSPDSY